MGPTLTDILCENLTVVFCGINPGLKSAMDGHHFSGRNNRFWKTLHLAGFTPHEIEARNDRSILTYGYGLTTAVERPTLRANQLSKEEFAASVAGFIRKMETYKPRYIAFLGKPAYAAFSGKKDITWGQQEDSFGGSAIWVLPNPSGLNRSFRLNDLVTAYKELRVAITQATGLPLPLQLRISV